ncbi:hypothetical protein COCVIDRAFT_115577, partial [Bipolaris victoriae FI3]
GVIPKGLEATNKAMDSGSREITTYSGHRGSCVNGHSVYLNPCYISNFQLYTD